MKNNVWLKQVCTDGHSYYSLKLFPKKSEDFLVCEEVISNDLKTIKSTLRLKNIDIDCETLSSRICLPSRRYNVVGSFYLDITKLSEKKFFYSMGLSRKFCFVTKAEAKIHVAKVLSLYTGYPCLKPEKSVSSKIVVFLFLKKRKLFEELKKKEILTEPTKRCLGCIKDDVNVDLFPKKVIIFDKGNDEFWKSLNLPKYVLTDEERMNMSGYNK